MRGTVEQRFAEPQSGAAAARQKPPPAGEIMKIKVWLTGIGPMIWRRLHVPDIDAL